MNSSLYVSLTTYMNLDNQFLKKCKLLQPTQHATDNLNSLITIYKIEFVN